jgi:hypothetical protein
MVEPQPSKLMMWVRYPSPAPDLPAWCGGLRAWSGEARLAHIAQVVEHSLGKGEVTGSSPVMGTTFEVLSNY